MLIINGTVVTWGKSNQILQGYAIFIENDVIREIGPQAELIARHPQEEKVDAGGQLVMPGNICAHTHYYGAFSRGMGIPGAAPKDFTEILTKLWWALDKSLSPEDVRYSTLVCLIDAIRHGTTTLFDHHASPNAIEGSLDEVAQAVIESGLRGSMCYEVTDRDGMAKSKAGIDENVRFIQRVQRGDNAGGRLAATFGLHASLTLSEETLDACREACPSNIGFHIHVAESSVDEFDSLAKCGLRVVDRLDKHQMLSDKTIVAHAVHIDHREVMLLAENHTWVSHQPRSNMNNAVGVAPVESYIRAGIPVCLGNDGFSNSMWDEWKAAYLVHKLWNHDPRWMSGSVVAQMAMEHNAALTTQQFGLPIGALEPGAQADLIFVDYHPFTDLNAGNLPWHIIFGFHDSMVTATMVAGKMLMYHRELLTLDEEAISAHARELSAQTWKRYQKQFAD